MKFFATTKCPNCGHKDVQELNGPNFTGKEESKCSKCGQLYSTPFNCLMRTNDEEAAKSMAQNENVKEEVNIIAFSTEELVKELERRSVSI